MYLEFKEKTSFSWHILSPGKWIWICNYLSYGLREWLQVHFFGIVVLNAVESNRSDCWSCGNRIPESLPCLHDKVLAAAAEAAISFSTDQRRKQVSIHVFLEIEQKLVYILASQETSWCRILQQGLLVASLKEWKARLKKMQKWEKFWHRTPSEHLESIFLKEPFAEPSIPNLDDPIEELSIGS